MEKESELTWQGLGLMADDTSLGTCPSAPSAHGHSWGGHAAICLWPSNSITSNSEEVESLVLSVQQHVS